MSIKKRAMFLTLAAAANSPAARPLMALPFATLLLMIAAAPLCIPTWWHHHYPKVAAGLGLITVSYYVFGLQNAERYTHVAHEYLSFIVLIGALFVVAGGVHIGVKGEAKPLMNVAFLAFGAVIANFIGTTGASMLLIRPWIRMNKYRITAFHIVIFIFIVSNVGGCLTPIGDPPLFLGYLKNVPFWWPLQHAWPAWIVTVSALLVVFYVLDLRNFRKAPTAIRSEMSDKETWKLEGVHNLLFISVILAAVLGNRLLPIFVPEAIMIAAAAASYFSTRRQIHEANHFSFGPIKEVAWLFGGIFATMVPALDWLGANASQLGITTPIQFYFATGFVSSVLDNAPTYLAFLSAHMGMNHLDMDQMEDMRVAVAQFPLHLLAISLGAVFFGAMTYIGNGPNLMVKAIADHARVKTPDFLTYIFRYAFPILFPILVIVSILFFSPWRIL